ncbi:MAG TPA: class I SAM-dependent methyltransferase [Gemmatimonadaceae bacterium]
MSRAQLYDERVAEYYELIPLSKDRRDLEFYLGYARQAGGRVLELGCGTGRILVPIAAAGLEVVGLDLSDAMLAKCREKLQTLPAEAQSRVQLVRGDMTNFDLGETFALAIIPFRPFQHLLTVEQQLACLGCIARHLAPKGKLVFDVFQPDLRRLHDPVYRQETDEVPERTLADGRRFRVTSRVLAFRRAEQINEVELIYHITSPDGREERIVEPLTLRYFFRYEMEHLLARGGFRVMDVFGDFDRSPLRDDSPEMIFVAEKTT